VTFWSGADNLVDGDANGVRDVFLHDLLTGETSLVSVASDGTQGNANSFDSAINADGSRVAFWSEADNLVDGDLNGYLDVFLHVIASGETLLISLTSDGMQGDGDSSLPVVSADGRLVGFESDATNLVTGDTNEAHDIFVHELEVAPPSFSISGTVTDGNGDPLSGVEIDCDCGTTATSEADGTYAITGLVTGTYTLTPSFPDFTFTPPSRSVSVPPDAEGQDFTGEAVIYTYEISGQVLDDSANPLAGVLVTTDAGLTTTTDAGGNYAFAGLLEGSYTFTPTLAGYVFSPASRTASLPPDASDQDFTGALVTYAITGTVTDGEGNPLLGVLITAADGYTATTDSEGNYHIEGLLPGTYTVTAALAGYTFEPAARLVTLPPDAAQVDFTAIPEAESIFVWLPILVK
jgi:protocatechuate 3,4-dioxygenase beta subunit